ncbi:MAG: hypothetical protein ACRDD8_12410 [Bacteroidales bacterium]
MNNQKWIYFDGYNDEELVVSCSRWEYGLCPIHKRFVNKITSEDTLFIEPADTMRGSGKNIPMGSIVDLTHVGNKRIIQPRKLTEEEYNLKSKLEMLSIKNIAYQKSDLRMNYYNNEWFISFYLIDFCDAPYEWHGETTDYKIDFNKSFLENLQDIIKEVEENGIELEW